MSTESLNVVALVSGGKDSFFSILHCLKNGHRVIALANLYPDVNGKVDGDGRDGSDGAVEQDNVNDEEIDSHMYQTVGASIIPLYASALNLPLYRQPISGSAINTSRDYTLDNNDDETESLLPLLTKVLAAHPEINAISTGAILSSYQRTRIESVALRLGLTPLGYLWQYPYLPPYTQDSLLRDMAAVGQDARIIKAASGGLDERHLWLNVADPMGATVGKLAREMGRFGGLVGGSVLGEGGEYETLAVDGPVGLWKRRIVVAEAGRRVCGGGGVWSLRMKGAVVEEKEALEGKGEDEWMESLRVPELFDQEFERLLRSFELEPEGRRKDGEDDPVVVSILHSDTDNTHTTTAQLNATPLKYLTQSIHTTESTLYISNLHHPPELSTTNTNSATLTPSSASSLSSTQSVTSSTTTPPNEQFTTIATQLLYHLSTHTLNPSHITHTTILLRSMSLFTQINTAYAALFTTPNPPSRVTVACGDKLPEGVDVVLSAICHLPRRKQGHSDDGGDGKAGRDEDRIGLHVQSRSYWAPANIGPYSQGISVPVWDDDDTDDTDDNDDNDDTNSHSTDNPARIVYIAGQIPLVPSTMSLPTSSFTAQAILSLQHLWRIGRVMNVDWWISCVAFITADSPADAKGKAKRVGEVWRGVHAPGFLPQNGDDGDDDDDGEDGQDQEEEEIDIAEQSLRGNRPWAVTTSSSIHATSPNMKTSRRALPNWPALALHTPTKNEMDNFHGSDYEILSTNIPPPPTPPIFTAQITSLPRSSSIEWAALGLEIDKKRAHITRCEEGEILKNICHIHDHSGALVLQVVHAAVRDAEDLMVLLGTINISEEPGLVEVFVCDRGQDSHFLVDTVRCSVQVIPCESVWNVDGKEVFAAVRWREHV